MKDQDLEAATPSSSRLIRFSTFEVNLVACELRKNGVKIKLQKQPFQILEILLENAGEVVTREQITSKIWPGDTFVDFEHSVNTAVKKLRQALGDRAENPFFIETLPRQGFRFIAELRTSPERGTAPGPDIEPRGPHQPRPLVSRRALGWVALALIAASALGIWKLRPWRAPVKSETIRSLAVLPLANLSADRAQEYFADGMTEALITSLAQIRALNVISRTSVMQYRGTRKPLPQIARELNVDAVVEGAVARAGDRVQITAQLIQAAADRHLWAATYQGSIRDILALENDVARDIANQIKVRLTAQEKAGLAHSRPVDPEAYEAYLQGRYFWGARTQEGLKRGLEYFEQAIEKDPGYARAYAGLADTYAVLGHHGYLSPEEAAPKARMASEKALQIDDSLAEAHTSLALVKHAFDWDWPGAELEFKRAIALNPNYATAHHWYAHYLVSMGRLDEALTEIKRARDLDPFSPVINIFEGLTLYFGRHYEQALDHFRNALPNYANFAEELHNQIGNVYEAKGLTQEAVGEWQAALTVSGQTRLSEALAQAYKTSGYRGYLRRELEYLDARQRGSFGSALGLARIAARLGDHAQAFRWLEKSYAERDPWLLNLGVDPAFDGLHSDLRFTALVHRIGLPASSIEFAAQASRGD